MVKYKKCTSVNDYFPIPTYCQKVSSFRTYASPHLNQLARESFLEKVPDVNL